MKSIDLYQAFCAVDDGILERSEGAAGGRKRHGWLKWGVMAACFSLILTAALTVLPGVLKGPDNPLPPPVPAPTASEEDDQTNTEPQPSLKAGEIMVNWDNVVVNESKGLAPDAALRYYDPALYSAETWDEQAAADYYGWNLAPGYVPDGLRDGQGVSAGIWREKATGTIVQDQAGRGFWADFWEDGSPKSDDGIVIPRGFTVTASRSGILRCGLLPADGAQTTDFGGTAVTLSHCSMKHGPFDPTQKAPDGLSNMPAGYYDIYTAAFTLDGVEYEITAQRLELEELVKITASVLNTPYSQDFTVGGAMSGPDKGAGPGEYPDTVILPGFALDEPNEPGTP